MRISVSNLDFNFLQSLPEAQRRDAMTKLGELVDGAVAPKFDMDLEMLWGADGRPMRLQAVQKAQSPINRHPETGRPVWFCNLHNQARFLRERRPCGTPEVGMTDIYFGDLGLIPGEMLQHINEVSRGGGTACVVAGSRQRVSSGWSGVEGGEPIAGKWRGGGKVVGVIFRRWRQAADPPVRSHAPTLPLAAAQVSEKNIVTVPMQPGDVLLCDNYRVLHGRDIFAGDRLHAVSWFGDRPLEDVGKGDKPGDFLNVILNSAF